MGSRDANEIERLWARQRLLVLERCPGKYQEIKSAIEEGRGSVLILNMIDAALDRSPTPATIISAATQGFDQVRSLATPGEREDFLELLNLVNRLLASPSELKKRLFQLAVKHHATALLEGTYFDDIRSPTALAP